jgi:endonuclease/exonuclease/phosphatase family metal-dependent hydrolase
MSHIDLRGYWCNIIVLNVDTPSEKKSDDSKDSFDEELDQVSHHIPQYHMKILLGDFNAKLGREDIFKLIIGNESLHQYSNDNGVRRENFTTSKNLVVKSSMFPQQNIHKYSWTSPEGKTDSILIDKRWHSCIPNVWSFSGAHCDTDHYVVVARVGETLTVSKQVAQTFDVDRQSQEYQ